MPSFLLKQTEKDTLNKNQPIPNNFHSDPLSVPPSVSSQLQSVSQPLPLPIDSGFTNIELREFKSETNKFQAEEYESTVLNYKEVNEAESEANLKQSQLSKSSISQETNKTIEYSFAWSLATQKGYKYSNNTKLDIHAQMEDMHYPSQTTSTSPNNFHKITNKPFQVFMIADGHGGSNCAFEAVNSIPPALINLVNEKVWDFRLSTHKSEFSLKLVEIFRNFDREYCNSKLREFKRWVDDIICDGGSLFDGKYRGSRPLDDGCTLVLNLIYDGYIVNANVGDSRTVVLEKERNNWGLKFASVDHTTAHPEKASQVHSNGGRFIYNGENVLITSDFDYKLLDRCRIGRPLGWRIKELNYPSCTTLNLTGTAGDLFFKYDPPLISCTPDVSFIEMESLGDLGKYMILMASDGLWDHMVSVDEMVQNEEICDYVDKRYTSVNDVVEYKLEKLGNLAHGLADREGDSGLFARGFVRYDDITVFVVLVEGIKGSDDFDDSSEEEDASARLEGFSSDSDVDIDF